LRGKDGEELEVDVDILLWEIDLKEKRLVLFNPPSVVSSASQTKMTETITSLLQSFLNTELGVFRAFLGSLVNDVLFHHRNNIEATLDSLYDIIPAHSLPELTSVLREKKEEFLMHNFPRVFFSPCFCHFVAFRCECKW